MANASKDGLEPGAANEGDAEALAARLEAELRLRRLSAASNGAHEPLTDLRLHKWINSHLPIGWPRWPKGLAPKVVALLQRVVRRLLRWYIDPIVAQQNAFNDQVVAALEAVYREIAQESATAWSERSATLALLQRVVTQLQANATDLPSLPPAARMAQIESMVSGQPLKRCPLGADHLNAFAARLALVRHLEPAGPTKVLVLGLLSTRVCGQARALGLDAIELGAPSQEHVDAQAPAATDGQASADATRATLAAVDDNSLLGIVWAGGLWRLDVAGVLLTVQQAWRALAPHGLLLLESVDPHDDTATADWVWSDGLACRPYTAELAGELLQAGGFAAVDPPLAAPGPEGRASGWFAIAAEKGVS